MPTMTPTIAMFFTETMPVEYAMAFGGVEIGSDIPSEVAIATTTAIIMVLVPGSATDSEIASGTSRLAALPSET